MTQYWTFHLAAYETRVYPFTICKTHDKHKKFLLSIYDDNGIDDADDHEGIMEAGCTDQGSCISSLLSLSYLSEWEPAEENWDPFELDQGEGWLLDPLPQFGSSNLHFV